MVKEVKLRLDIGLPQKLQLKSLIFVAKGRKRRLKEISKSEFKLLHGKVARSLVKDTKRQHSSDRNYPFAHKTVQHTITLLFCLSA